METLKRFAKYLLLFTAFLVTSKTYAQCPAGLISYWNMNEPSGLTLIDQAGGHNAICNEAPDLDPIGRIGSAHFFTSDSNSGVTATIPNSSAFNFPVHSSFTIIYWVKYSPGDLAGRTQVVVSRGDYRGGSAPGTFWAGGIEGEGNLFFILKDSLSDRVDLQTPLAYDDGNWHQVAFVRDEATKTNTLFVDGTESIKTSHEYSGSFTSSEEVMFCQLKNTVGGSPSYGYFYQGSLDEVAILTEALTAQNLSNQILLANSDVGICDGLNANLLSIPVTQAIVGSLYTYKVHAGGLENGMSYSLLSAPEGMIIDPLTGLISWTPMDITAQAFVTVIAENYVPPADTQSFRIFMAEGTPCPDDLLVLLKLDESFGPVYADFYGVHNAEATISPVSVQGKIGVAQLFNSTSGLDIPDLNTEFDWSQENSFSIEYWLKTTTKKMMVCVARHRIDILNAAVQFAGIDDAGKALLELRDNSGNLLVLTGTTMIADGNWHHVVNVRNGATNENLIYVDGVMETNLPDTFTDSFTADDPTPITVGYLKRSSPDHPGYHFLGSLDEVAIYNRAVTAGEISDYYDSGKGHCGVGNFAPYVTSEPVTEGTLNEAYSYFFMGDDLDLTDVLTLSAVEKPQWIVFNWLPGQKSASLSGIPATEGQYPVTLRLSDGKVDIDQEFTIVVSESGPTGINDLESEGILIYPVPANDKLIIYYKESKGLTQLEIINSDGKILRRAVLNPGEERYTFGLNDIASGTYWIRIKNDRISKTGSFIIAR